PGEGGRASRRQARKRPGEEARAAHRCAQACGKEEVGREAHRGRRVRNVSTLETSSLIAMSAPDPMQAPAIRWGILGAGGIAAKFADAVKDFTQSTVVAAASASSLERAQGFVAAH